MRKTGSDLKGKGIETGLNLKGQLSETGLNLKGKPREYVTDMQEEKLTLLLKVTYLKFLKTIQRNDD